MFNNIQSLAASMEISPEIMILSGLGIGIVLVFWSIAANMGRKSVPATRIAALKGAPNMARLDKAILKTPTAEFDGFTKAFAPGNEKERSELKQRLLRAGFTSPNALRYFVITRAVLGLILPGLLLALVVITKMPGASVPSGLAALVSGLTNFQIKLFLAFLVGAGYFGPNFWLNNKVKQRTQKIEEGFPNALDLMRISVEAGLGFDAAMARVGNELTEISPEISLEFLSAQRQVQAGRPRDAALMDMADRTGVDTVRSFAKVTQQSMQFGTSMSQALSTYSDELRNYREMKAQEMANKLPVKMSAVLAALMLPALIMLTIGPNVIRYIRYFSG